MGEFKVENSTYKTPPEDSYFLDLVWIEGPIDGENGQYYRWHWRIADIDSQKEFANVPVTSQTTLTPTLNNRFGNFLKSLLGTVEVDYQGTTEELSMGSYRAKGFVEHNKKIYDGEEVTFCNVKKLIEGSVKKGAGVGYQGAGERIKPIVNEYLKKIGKPLLKLEEVATGQSGMKNKNGSGVSHTVAQKRQDIPW